MQGSSLHQLEGGRVYAAAVKAHSLIQLLLFPGIYLTQERRGITRTVIGSVAVLCTQTGCVPPLMLLPSHGDPSSSHYIAPLSFPIFFFLARCQVPMETERFPCLRGFCEQVRFYSFLLQEGANILAFLSERIFALSLQGNGSFV